jgi:hypothetical protein
MNSREIPRLHIVKKIDLSDLESQDMVCSPDYCDVCIMYIMRILERKRKLIFKLSYIGHRLNTMIDNRK